MQPFLPSRSPSQRTHRMAVVVSLGMFLCVLELLSVATGPLHAAVGGESVGISLTVVGQDLSSSSSASSSEDAATVSTSGGGGGRRYSIDHSRLRIVRLLQEWSRRRDDTLHAAPKPMPFKDVPSDAWYAPVVHTFVTRGWLDTSSGYFRPADGATRAEVAKLLVESSAQARRDVSGLRSFSDVPSHAWFHPYIEEAASHGWMLGYRDCYGSTSCYTRPTAIVTRSEGAALILRALDMQGGEAVPHTFSDVPSYAWYHPVMSAAADHCMIQADEKNMVRPDQLLNRAELVTMLSRALARRTETVGCDYSTPLAELSTSESAKRVMDTLIILWGIR